MTGPLILAADVEIAPASRLAARTRARLGARRGEYAVTRPRGRAPAKLVSGAGAALLGEFREARLVVEAVRGIAARDGRDPARLLDEAFPLLRDCFNARFLVAAGSPESARILPSRERGDAIGPFEVLRCLRVLEDTELYQVRDGRGGVAAVKLVRRHAGPEASASLAREAAVLEHLGGAGAPALLARGRHRHRPWLAMSWCDGVAPDVAFGELRERGVAARGDLRTMALRVARAYARLHRAGVLHGDVHPGNLLIGRRGEVTLLDFGLARPIGAGRLAGRASVGGVTALFAPEQAAALLDGADLPAPTPASELYAVAAMLYRLIAGAPAVAPAPDRDGMLRRIFESPPRPFAQAGAAPWPAVEAVLARSLDRNPAARHASLGALARALAGVAVPRPRRATPVRDPLAGVVDRFVERVDFGSAAFGAPGPAPACSLMLGRAGLAYALLRIAFVRNDPAILALADAWLTRTERDLGDPRAFESPEEDLTLETLGAASPFHGPPGVHTVRTLLALAMNDARAAAAAARRFAEASQVPRRGLDLTMGRAGTLLAATRLVEAMPAPLPGLRAALRTLGDAELGEIWRALDGAEVGAGAGAAADAGIAHGLAGILYATLGWCTATGRALPSTFRRRLAGLADAAEPLGRGVRWAQPDAAGVPGVWATHDVAGWCNGPAGIAHLWIAAHARWGRPADLALATSCGWSAWEARSPAPDLCCGHAGRAYALLSLYRHTGDGEWLARARSLAAMAREAFERGRDSLARPLSLFKGEAGLAALAADLERPEAAVFPFFSPDALDHDHA